MAIFYDSKNLISDYNGFILFSDGFRWCFILINIGVFVGSLLCLVALLLVTKQKIKLKLLNCFVINQSILALVTLLFMSRLWFVPFKLELDSDAWLSTIRWYNYEFEIDSNGLWPNGFPSRVQDHNLLQEASNLNNAYNYREKVDRLQQTIGCCGIWGPEDWKQNEFLHLSAPSCCPNPSSVLIEFPDITQSLIHQNDTGSSDIYITKQFFYCQWVLSASLGCQQALNDRETNFLFRIRITLLLLIGILFLNVLSKAFLKFKPLVLNSPMMFVGMEQSLASSSPPPSYDQSRSRFPFAFGDHNLDAKNPPSYQLSTTNHCIVGQPPPITTICANIGCPIGAIPARICSIDRNRIPDPPATIHDDTRANEIIESGHLTVVQPMRSEHEIQKPIDRTVLTML